MVRGNGYPGQNGFARVQQGYLESSNVNVVEEMVNMITAQRAYEINSNRFKHRIRCYRQSLNSSANELDTYIITQCKSFLRLLVEGTPIQLGSILAPVDADRRLRRSKNDKQLLGLGNADQQKVKYEWIHMHNILGRLESMLIPEIAVDDRISLASRSHWDPVKIKLGSSWDLTLTNPFIPDARGRWYPSIELYVDGVSKVKRRLTVNVALYRELWQVDQQLKQGDLLDRAQLVPTIGISIP